MMLSPGLSISPAHGQIPALVHQTNPVLLENLREVNHQLDDLPTYFFDDNKNSSGEYNGVYRTISMEATDEGYEEFTWWHELAHHIWYWHLTDAERIIWRGTWGKDTLYYINDIYPYYPTEYAKTDPHEDFADSFARFIYEYNHPEKEMFFRTENLDPERELILTLILQRILDGTCYQNDTIQDCVQHRWVNQ